MQSLMPQPRRSKPSGDDSITIQMGSARHSIPRTEAQGRTYQSLIDEAAEALGIPSADSSLVFANGQAVSSTDEVETDTETIKQFKRVGSKG